MLPEMLEDPYVEVALKAPPSPDYIPGPEEPEQAPPSPDYVPEDDDDEDPEEDHVDYPADGGDDGDDEEESSKDDEDEEDDEMDVEADEEEHPAPADSVVVAPTAADQALSAEETDPFETDESAATPPPHPAYRTTARISIPALVPMPAWTDSELPSASRREDRPEVTLPPRKRLDITLGPRYEVGKSSYATAARPTGGFRADYGFVATVDREIMCDPEREVGYGITDSWDEIMETLQGAPVRTDTELGRYVREFEMRVRQDTDEIYMRLDDEQTERQLLAGRLNMLFTNRRQMSEIRKLQATDRRRQTVILELLKIDHMRSIEILELRTALQGQVTALQGQVTALQAQVTTLLGQQGLARDHTQSELPEKACKTHMKNTINLKFSFT
nr:hypothetical protein [Tanacetum cinerariifolium]